MGGGMATDAPEAELVISGGGARNPALVEQLGRGVQHDVRG